MASIATRPHPRLSKAQRRRLKKRQARKARAARRRLRALVEGLPQPAAGLFGALAGAFSRPTYLRAVVLALGALLTAGCRTVCNLLRTLGALAPGHQSSYHRVLSRRAWSGLDAARALAGLVLRWLAPQGPVLLAGDDTVSEHTGDHVHGKGCHRDPVRSSRGYTAFRWGHKWVVLAVLVPLPFSRRRWALPVLAALYQPEGADRRQGRRHKTPADLLRQLLVLLLRWFPDRQFACAADGGYASHDLAGLGGRCGGRLTLVSRFYADAHLRAPVAPLPPGVTRRGRPPQKGPRLPTPAEAVAAAPGAQRLEVGWYGGGRRAVEAVSGCGLWYRAGQALVAVRWVFVRDRTGGGRDEYFFSTDPGMSPQAVIEAYAARWNLEVTFQEVRAYLGLGTTRGRCRETVRRAEPCLLGLYSVVALLYARLPGAARRQRAVDWAGKEGVTFSDAITAVRRWLWRDWVLSQPELGGAFAELPAGLRRVLLRGLAPAA
jgi:DDE superfamily endonuclease